MLDLALNDSRRRRVLVTGASGNIGSFFAKNSHHKYDLRLMIQRIDEKSRAIEAFGQVVTCELSDLEKLKLLCADIDTVLHLAGDPNPNQKWDSALQNNIVGTYNVMVAAKFAGCRRVIYASSIHAVSGYPADVQVKASEPAIPVIFMAFPNVSAKLWAVTWPNRKNCRLSCCASVGFSRPKPRESQI